MKIFRSRLLQLVTGAVCLPISMASAHPIHMSYTEVRYTSARPVEISIRLYANDFSAAAARRARVRLKSDSLIDIQSAMAYLNQNVQVVDAKGISHPLASCGISRTRDMLRFCFTVAGGVGSLRMRNSVMTELFGDQVNVVQTVSSKGRSSRLFVRGDGWKTID